MLSLNLYALATAAWLASTCAASRGDATSSAQVLSEESPVSRAVPIIPNHDRTKYEIIGIVLGISFIIFMAATVAICVFCKADAVNMYDNDETAATEKRGARMGLPASLDMRSNSELRRKSEIQIRENIRRHSRLNEQWVVGEDEERGSGDNGFRGAEREVMESRDLELGGKAPVQAWSAV